MNQSATDQVETWLIKNADLTQEVEQLSKELEEQIKYKNIYRANNLGLSLSLKETVANLKEVSAYVKRLQGWISVNDRLPDTAGNYLIVASTSAIDMVWFSIPKEAWCTDTWTYDDVTHWMPLPERPNEYTGE